MNKASGISDFQAPWVEIAEGIEFVSLSLHDPRLRISALRIDLRNPSISIVVGPEPLEFGKVRSSKTTSFVRRYGCLAGINANPFDPSTAVEDEERRIVGIMMFQGKVLAAVDKRYAALVFHRDGSAEVLEQRALTITGETGEESIVHAIGGFFIVLNEGLPQGDGTVRHPRTAAGVSADGRILYLLVIDGRSLSSVGATEKETGAILAALGARKGLILDGGGSTVMALRQSDGSVHPVNTPIHNILCPGQERAVATCLGIAHRGSR